MYLLQRTYHTFKAVPIVGDFLMFLRQTYLKSHLARRRLFKRDLQKAHAILGEMFGISSEVHEHLNRFVKSNIFKSKFSYGHSGDFDVMMLYAFTRQCKPEVVVETGVASGRSSAAILIALSENQHGTLFSIDLPQFHNGKPSIFITHEGNNELDGFVPEGEQPGWLVPDNLRNRWKLILGDAKKELVTLLNTIDSVDMFYHDSDHSGEHMQFEFNLLYPKIKKGGYVFSDDISWNDAWKNFVIQENLNQICTYRNFGIAQK